MSDLWIETQDLVDLLNDDFQRVMKDWQDFAAEVDTLDRGYLDVLIRNCDE